MYVCMYACIYVCVISGNITHYVFTYIEQTYMLMNITNTTTCDKHTQMSPIVAKYRKIVHFTYLQNPPFYIHAYVYTYF